ncbi:ANTAR domain-containing protein [Streptomyces avermitilis]|uniref:ANTAR domain-containing protein n=1 Tax=Streptomyces avermitilis TaxID=33903 RepID=UPI0033A22908
MTTSRVPRSSPDGKRDDATIARLEQKNAQLRHAVNSHATVDQAIGVLTAIHRLAPAAGFEVLREVSQRTNIKLHTVAESVMPGRWGSRCRSRWGGSWARLCTGGHASTEPQTGTPARTPWPGTARVRRSGPA